MQKKTIIEPLSTSLRRENKSNDLFEIMLNNLTLEEIIGLKLELVHKTVGSNLYGLPLWRSTIYIVRDALLKYAFRTLPSRRKAMHFLGIDPKTFKSLIKRYKIFPVEKSKEQNDIS